MSLSAAEQRKRVVETMKSLEDKNTFSQSTRYRLRVDNGYGDSASTIQYVYRTALNMNLGTYIVAQYTSRLGVDVEEATETNYLPEENKLLPGDLLFFKSKEKNNPYGVSHVEMYLGNNLLMGHAYGKGPTIKNMMLFCKSREAAGKGFLKARRFILFDILDQVSEELVGRLQFVLNTAGLRDRNRNSLIVDHTPGPLTLSACPILRKGKDNPIVAVMQEGLLQLGYRLEGSGANGFYGNETIRAVKEFERDHNLKTDGIFETDDWKVWLGIEE